jgi:hypothetical protein
MNVSKFSHKTLSGLWVRWTDGDSSIISTSFLNIPCLLQQCYENQDQKTLQEEDKGQWQIDVSNDKRDETKAKAEQKNHEDRRAL